MVSVSFSDLELGKITVELDFQVLKLLSINIGEFEVEIVGLFLEWLQFESSSSHIDSLQRLR